MQSLPMESLIKVEGEAVAKELRQRFNYALINPLIVQARDWQDLSAVALETIPAPASPHRLPQLIDLGSIPGPTYNDLINRIRRYDKRGLPFFSALLNGKASVETMAANLKQHLLQRRPRDRQYHWFRYYDPLVFRHMSWLLTPTQLARLLGPITQWSWPDAYGRWQTLERPGDRPTIDWLELSLRQWACIDRFAELNRSLRRLDTLTSEWPQDPTHWQWLDDTLCHAEAFHLARDDQSCLVEQAARYLPDLAGQNLVKQLITLIIRRFPDMAGRLNRLSDNEWNILVSDARSGHE